METEHIYDDDGICWCDPIKHIIESEQEMIEIFGQVFEGMSIPCNIWRHRQEN